MKKEKLFEDIQIIVKKGGIPKPVHTIGWKFKYGKDKYGNYISDQVPTGKFFKYWDDEENCEVTSEIMKTVPIPVKAQIELLKGMIKTMELLIEKK